MKTLAALCAWLLVAPIHAATRLAVLADDAAGTFADLLMAELSKQPDVTLVEREEIDRILKEQQLVMTGLSTADSARLGHLLKADGLLVIDAPDKAAGLALLRLISVSAGAVVVATSDPWPPLNPETWAKLRGTEFARSLPKLSLRREEVTPLSVLRIRSLSQAAESLSVEAAVNRLFVERLTAERGLIVLERRRLQDAAAEKSLSAESDPFWTSAWVIDGSMVSSPEQIQLKLRLQPPDSTEAKTFTIEAGTPAAAVEIALNKVTELLWRVGTSFAWSSERESARLYEEAKWARKIGQTHEALEAIEASIALGGSSREHMEMRWSIYAGLARADRYALFSRGEDPATGARRVRSMIRSLQLFQEVLTAVPDAGPPDSSPTITPGMPPHLQRPTRKPGIAHSRNPWRKNGESLLRDATEVLGDFPPKHGPVESELKELRKMTRGIFALMQERLPWLTLTPRKEPKLPAPFVRQRESGVHPAFFQIRFEQGELWEEQLEDFFPYMRQCFASEMSDDPVFFPSAIVNRFQPDKGGTLPGPPRQRMSEEDHHKWLRFGYELIDDGDLGCQVGGCFLLLSLHHDAESAISVFGRNKEAILRDELPLGYLDLACAAMNWSRGAPITEWNRSIHPAQRIVKDVLLHLLAHDHGLRAGTLQHSVFHNQFSPSDAEELYQAMSLYIERKRAANLAHPSMNFYASLRRSLAGKAGHPEPDPSEAAARAEIADAAKDVRLRRDPLLLTRAWVAPVGSELRCVLPGRAGLWAQTSSGDNPVSAIQFFRIALPSLHQKPVHQMTGELRRTMAGEGWPPFAVDGESILFCEHSQLRHASATGVKNLHAPALNNPSLWMVTDWLYASTAEGLLLRIHPERGVTEILASALRNPPESLLDREPHLRFLGRVFPAPDARVMVSLLGKTSLFAFDENERLWTKAGVSTTGSVFNRKKVIEFLTGSWDANRHFQQDDYMHLILKDFEQVGANRGIDPKLFAAYTGGASEKSGEGKARTTVLLGGVAEGETVWALLRVYQDKSLYLVKIPPKPDIATSRLLALSDSAFPVDNERDAGIAGRTLGEVFGMTAETLSEESKLIVCAEGMVIYSVGGRGFWFIPRADLESGFDGK